jgi:hypothetical protein
VASWSFKLHTSGGLLPHTLQPINDSILNVTESGSWDKLDQDCVEWKALTLAILDLLVLLPDQWIKDTVFSIIT